MGDRAPPRVPSTASPRPISFVHRCILNVSQNAFPGISTLFAAEMKSRTFT